MPTDDQNEKELKLKEMKESLKKDLLEWRHAELEKKKEETEKIRPRVDEIYYELHQLLTIADEPFRVAFKDGGYVQFYPQLKNSLTS